MTSKPRIYMYCLLKKLIFPEGGPLIMGTTVIANLSMTEQ